MEKFLIESGSKINGEIEVNGAKNSVLKILAASVLFKNNLIIQNIPLIEDVFRLNDLLKKLGASVRIFQTNNLEINSNKINNWFIDKKNGERIRASIVLTGPILARFKKVVFPYPGGCVIGKRPIDLFLDGFKNFGVKIKEKNNFFYLTANKLKGCDYTFKNVSVTATETLMLVSIFAEGKTVLRNCACEPEIPYLAKFLNNAGAQIKGAGTHTIEIIGKKSGFLKTKKPFYVMPDRIETGSFLILGSLLAEKLLIKNCQPEHLMVPIKILKDIGVELEIDKDKIFVKKAKKIKSIDIKTEQYPGFPTDLQAPFVVLLTQAYGQSKIFETIFEGRLNYINELNRMGAKIIMCDLHRAIVIGPTKLRGREIESPDLRAGLAFILAGAIAKGTTKINNIYQIDRGYEKIEIRLSQIGLKIKRIEE